VQKVFLVLSFDHELSLGGARSYAHNLFEPADALLDTANALKVPICFFTDILCQLRFKEWDPAGFCVGYERQLQRAVQEGHEVQLHLHPHWVEVGFADGRFALGNRYSLGDFASEPPPQDMEGILRQGVVELRRICAAADSRYSCRAYRAGGYSYGAAEEPQTELLWRHGLRVEASVAKGYCLRTQSSSVNFRQMPAVPNWFIEPGGRLASAGAKGLFEVPIAAAPRTPANNLVFLVKRVLARRHRRDSGGAGFHAEKDRWVEKLARLFPRSAWMLSFDSFTQTAADLVAILQSHLRRHPGADTVYCSAIGHPKSMGPYQLRLFRDFVTKAREVFGSRLCFTTYDEVAKAQGR
jgi:hypothetical protein